MATLNLDEFFRLQSLLLDLRLPRLYRLRANFALADLHECEALAEEYRLGAERSYTELRELLPVGNTIEPKLEPKLVLIRAGLDELAEERSSNNRAEVDNEDNTEESAVSIQEDLAAREALSSPTMLPNIYTYQQSSSQMDSDHRMADDELQPTSIAYLPSDPPLLSVLPSRLMPPARASVLCSPKRKSCSKDETLPADSPMKKHLR
ncbi:unnamed protein product [Zymoseptoria tritici ST99CH_3D1]|nr:unnamed protein product [Zymoseptoria tritici ST99CH_3D1]